MSDLDFGTDNNEFFLDLSDAEEVSSGEFKPLAAGRYQAVVDKVEQKTTKAGDPALDVTLSIGNRKVFDNIMLRHANEVVTKIGRARAKSLFIAGLGQASGNFLELAGKIVDVKVTIDKKDTSRNNVQEYFVSTVGGDDVAF